MIPEFESVPVNEIVDFEEQIQLFTDILERKKEQKIIIVNAPGLMGKTCLLRLIKHVCVSKKIPCSYINFRGNVPYSHPHLSLARELFIKWDMQDELFRNVLKRISGFEGFFESRGVHIEEGEVQARDIVGGNVIQNSLLANFSGDRERLLGERWFAEQLNNAFLADIQKYARNSNNVVCLFDTFEDIGPKEEDWIIKTLLLPIREGILENVVVVIAGKRPPYFRFDWDWEPHTIKLENLPSLSVQNIKEYGKRIGLILSEEDATIYWKATKGGKPFFVGLVVKNLATMSGDR